MRARERETENPTHKMLEERADEKQIKMVVGHDDRERGRVAGEAQGLGKKVRLRVSV